MILTQRTLIDIQHTFGTGGRIRCAHTGRSGIVLMRSRQGVTLLWDGMDTPLTCQEKDVVGLPPQLTRDEQSVRWRAALDCESASSSHGHIDPFDTGSLSSAGGRESD